jgi:site-specific recombinase XerD
MYRYLATRYLARDPTPTKLGVQQYLADRLSEVSPALVSNKRKALASLFSFLHSEGLWPTNPLNGVGHVRVRYRERLCPGIGDVIRVLSGRCMRRRDTEKLRTLVLLLATTGLRITEAASILRDGGHLSPCRHGGGPRGAPEVRAFQRGQGAYYSSEAGQAPFRDVGLVGIAKAT